MEQLKTKWELQWGFSGIDNTMTPPVLSSSSPTQSQCRGVGEGGQGGSCPLTFESWGAYIAPPVFHMLCTPPSSQLAPTPLQCYSIRGCSRISVRGEVERGG